MLAGGLHGAPSEQSVVNLQSADSTAADDIQREGITASRIFVESSDFCVSRLEQRCDEVARSAAAHTLCSEAACLVTMRLASSSPATPTWSELLHARIADTWITRPRALIWLDDKLEQGAHTQACCKLTEPIHVPILASLGADAPERPDRERVWHRLRELVVDLIDQSARGGVEAASHGLVVKPRHGHDAKGVTVWTGAALASCATLDDALRRVWQSLEMAMACYDESWRRECWQVAAVPRGAVVQPLYECSIAAGKDCLALNTTPCAVWSRDHVVSEHLALLSVSTDGVAHGETASEEKAGGTTSTPDAPDTAEEKPASSKAAIPRLVRSNMVAYPLELHVHVFFGGVVGASLRSHSNELWVDHTGVILLYSDFRALALARGAHRCRAFLRPEKPAAATPERGGDAGGFHPLVHRLERLLHSPRSGGPAGGAASGHSAAAGDWDRVIVPLSERLCAASGVEELRVDWLLGDPTLGPRIGETTYMGAAFAGMVGMSSAAASGLLTCAAAWQQATAPQSEPGITSRK